jgi:hypothetical protein
VRLGEAQALFQEAITAASPLDGVRLEQCFAGTPDLPAAERVAIYRGMYWARLADALRETFPNLARLLGEERFADLAEAYVAEHPSEHQDVGLVGRRLAEFLRENPDPDRPDLADLAQLEWARQEAFFAAPAEPAGPEVLSCLSPEAFAASALVLSPVLRVIFLDHEAVPLWRSLGSGQPPGSPEPGPAAAAVWRRGFDVLHCALPMDEARALEAAAAGGPLAQVCAAFADRSDPGPAAHAALSSWFAEGWVVGVATKLPAP